MSDVRIPESTWVKASRSVGQGACVEVAPLPDGRVAFRNSSELDKPPFFYTPAEFAAFLDGAKKGEFDHLVV